MKKGWKRAQALVTIVALLCMGTFAQAAGVVNPMTDYDDIETLRAAIPAVFISDAPEGAGEVYYSSIDGTVLQVMFTFGDHNYTYRAKAAESGKMTDEEERAFSGVYTDFDEDVDTEDIVEGDKIPFEMPALPEDGFRFEVEYGKKDPAALIHWYDPEAKARYCLYSESAGAPDMEILTVFEMLLAGE